MSARWKHTKKKTPGGITSSKQQALTITMQSMLTVYGLTAYHLRRRQRKRRFNNIEQNKMTTGLFDVYTEKQKTYTSIFNRDFYPTPNNVIERMLIGIDIKDKVILEPSAGKGNIVDYLQDNGAKEVIACEIEPELATIIQGKCRLIANDFLTVKSHDISHVNLIVMNPPFSADEKHILYAWDIAPNGCTIVSLCNDSVVSNVNTENKRKITQLIKEYGRSEYFGDCFTDAERRTGVEVACVYLTKPSVQEENFSEYFSMEEDFEEQREGIMTYNFVRDTVNRYVAAIKLFDRVLEVSSEMKNLTSHITQHHVKFGAFKDDYRGDKAYVTKEDYRKQLQKDCWLHLFEKMKMEKYLTKGVKDEINKFVEQQSEIPFTMKNTIHINI